MEERVNAILIIEILGKPADYIKDTLSGIVDKLGKEPEVKIISKSIAETRQVEEQEVFTTFAEVEIETSLPKLMRIIFGYMPSHIEIVEPEELKIGNVELNMFFSELAKKLHQYDELARALMIEREIIAKQIKEGKTKSRKKRKGKKD